MNSNKCCYVHFPLKEKKKKKKKCSVQRSLHIITCNFLKHLCDEESLLILPLYTSYLLTEQSHSGEHVLLGLGH